VVGRFAAGLAKVIAETPAREAPATRRTGPLEAAVRADKVRRAQVGPDPRPVAETSRSALLRAAAGRVRRRVRGQFSG